MPDSEKHINESAILERKALRLSIVGYILLGILAVVFALLSQSEAILLDGFFNIVSFVMSILTLRVAKLLFEAPGKQFQYGYMPFEPFLNLIKGLILIVVCAFALVSAVDALIDGGRELSAGTALIYSVIAMAGCFAVMAVQGRYARTANSPLLDLDVKSWQISAVISSAVAAAFIIAVILERTRYSHYVSYIDPLMVIVLVLMAIKLPVSALKEGILDLLLAAPPGDVQDEIKQRITAAIEGLPVDDVDIRMVKVGRQIFVTSVLVLPGDAALQAIDDLDRIRDKVASSVEGVHQHIVVDVLFTGNKSLLT